MEKNESMKNFITLEEAVKIAKERNNEIDMYQEYADAYEFWKDTNEDNIGGSESSFIVEKSGGKILRWAEYFMDLSRKVTEVGKAKKID